MMYTMNGFIVCVALSLLINKNAVNGFSTSRFGGVIVGKKVAKTTFFMSEPPQEEKEKKEEQPKKTTTTTSTTTTKTTIPSLKKELRYDEASGRFYEGDVEECAPEDEYCVIDEKSGKLIRLTIAEKERIFLDAMQAYYVNGRQLLNDNEFDALKEDLQWNGSPVVKLNRKENLYLAAVQAYLKGEPIMSDSEFDKLKSELKDDKSQFAVSMMPKCYIDTGICTVTLKEDFFRNNLLYLPLGIVLTIVWLGVGFEVIEPIIRLNPLFLALLGTPLITKFTKELTEKYIFQNKLIAYGPCPSCEAENRVYFGDILFVEGFSDLATVKCPNCKVEFNVQRQTLRASTLPSKNE